MQGDWSLRDEIGEWAARWYVLVLIFLIGGATGWGSAWVFPPDYEARAPLYVAFNSEALFTSPDDYKNAQFEEATDLMRSNEVLDEVLTVWDGDRDSLQAKISVQWRNAGRWGLVVQDRDPAQAAQVATRWREAAYEHLSETLSHALTFSHLDREVNLTARNLSDLTQMQTRLDAVETGLRTWLAEPDTAPVSAQDRSVLWAFAEEFSPPNRFPEESVTDRQVYRRWAEGLLAGLEVKRGLLEAENQGLQVQMAALSQAWQAEKTAARGLSAYLVVELRGEVEVKPVREPGLLALVGGVVGVLGWMGVRLVSVARNSAWKGPENV